MQDLSKLPSIEFATELRIESHNRVYSHIEKLWTVYMIRNLTKGRMYIGRTTNPKQRANNHFAAIKRREHTNIVDYDDEFEFVILANKLRWKEAAEKEVFYMQKFKTYKEIFGYNTKDPHFRKQRK